jgi:hypothetical protein
VQVVHLLFDLVIATMEIEFHLLISSQALAAGDICRSVTSRSITADPGLKTIHQQFAPAEIQV